MWWWFNKNNKIYENDWIVWNTIKKWNNEMSMFDLIPFNGFLFNVNDLFL